MVPFGIQSEFVTIRVDDQRETTAQMFYCLSTIQELRMS
jgi:hypothetical protein